eukprot:gnl/Hemi2/25757_TR8661_c0_g1_i1.p1 gnl/Hemi2/25757_TR8661_c0_g1~~gnl/Hemi2/25757_TR8661_c0_g1_i1.p1  ORF type:complete len:351 (+),score=121.19 gnl/Hemi2/25757_TR8661_c0_g1_i1:93-1145(+)
MSCSSPEPAVRLFSRGMPAAASSPSPSHRGGDARDAGPTYAELCGGVGSDPSGDGASVAGDLRDLDGAFKQDQLQAVVRHSAAAGLVYVGGRPLMSLTFDQFKDFTLPAGASVKLVGIRSRREDPYVIDLVKDFSVVSNRKMAFFDSFQKFIMLLAYVLLIAGADKPLVSGILLASVLSSVLMLLKQASLVATVMQNPSALKLDLALAFDLLNVVQKFTLIFIISTMTDIYHPYEVSTNSWHVVSYTVITLMLIKVTALSNQDPISAQIDLSNIMQKYSIQTAILWHATPVLSGFLISFSTVCACVMVFRIYQHSTIARHFPTLDDLGRSDLLVTNARFIIIEPDLLKVD